MNQEDHLEAGKELISRFEPRLLKLLEQESMSEVEFSGTKMHLGYAGPGHAEINGMTVRNISAKPQ